MKKEVFHTVIFQLPKSAAASPKIIFIQYLLMKIAIGTSKIMQVKVFANS